IELAKKNKMEFYTANPQDAFPNVLEEYKKEMKENNWDFGQDDEELFELAMHDRQYRDYKSGIAKKRFEEELEKAKAAQQAPQETAAPKVSLSKEESKEQMFSYLCKKYPNAKPVVATASGTLLWEIDVVDKSIAPVPGKKYKENDTFAFIQTYYGNEEIILPYEGTLVDTCLCQGTTIKKGDVIAWIE
ncbi:MAG: oxaloacetate decarboxylase, partial [Bacteroidales bacterium]|nr:oxaloacetate decarboxylase [Bacteroidales bacterium]